MWFWIGMLMVLTWGGWGYVRRRWWLREIERSTNRAAVQGSAAPTRFEEPHWIVLPDRIVTAIAGAAGVIGIFLMVASRWGWLDGQ